MSLSKSELKKLCQTAELAAKEAGDFIQTKFDSSYSMQYKEGGDSVASKVLTEIDLKAQKMVMGHLKDSIKKYDLGLLTEESTDDQSRLEKDYFWCIDPLDGTLPYTEHKSGYAVSIALIDKLGDPLIGVVNVPDLKAIYTCIKGEGLSFNNKDFTHSKNQSTTTLHVFMDRSLQSATHLSFVKKKLNEWARDHRAETQIHSHYGAVRNALGVMNSVKGCYFKFPKNKKGGGSIWDYAATRLFFEELGLAVSDASGERLNLNDPESSFMNEKGVLYATDKGLADFIVGFGKELD